MTPMEFGRTQMIFMAAILIGGMPPIPDRHVAYRSGPHGLHREDSIGQRPKDLTPHENLHHYWGAELRALRVARGLSLAELGHHLHCDPSYLAKIERAERPIPAELVENCDQALEAHGALVRLHTLAESDRDLAVKPGGQPSADVATDDLPVASPTGSLAGGASVPATPEIGDEIIVPACTSDGRVVFVSIPRRVVLQSLGSAAVGLAATPAAVPAATHRAAPLTGLKEVNPIEHFQQLRQVLIDNDNLFGSRHVIPVVREQIAIIQQLRSSQHGVDGQELCRVQAQYSVLCGGLYQDKHEYHLAESWTDRALALSHLAADHDLTVYILTAKARVANGLRVSADAIGAGEQALRMASPRSRLAVIAASRSAHGYALSGDQAATQRAHDQARELLDTLDDDPDSPYGPWLSENWIAINEAQSCMVLGDYDGAAQIFQDAITEFPARYRRTYGVVLARTALA